jgi:hypothetical protein
MNKVYGRSKSPNDSRRDLELVNQMSSEMNRSSCGFVSSPNKLDLTYCTGVEPNAKAISNKNSSVVYVHDAKNNCN